MDANVIIKQYRGLVHKMAQRYVKAYRLKNLREDLVQEGLIGLLEAAKTFDPKKNVQFITWATYLVRAKVSGAARRLYSVVARKSEGKGWKPDEGMPILDPADQCMRPDRIIELKDLSEKMHHVALNAHRRQSKVSPLPVLPIFEARLLNPADRNGKGLPGGDDYLSLAAKHRSTYRKVRFADGLASDAVRAWGKAVLNEVP